MQVAPDSEPLEQAQRQVLEACLRHEKPAGIPVKNREQIQQRREQGYRFFDLTNDLRMLQAEAERLLRET